MRLLLTEDEQGIVDFMERGLKSEGFAVDVARNGAEGARMAVINEYDLILMDFMMPELDGISATKKLREKGITTPLIMLTVIDDKENIVSALDAGADDYLTKPFSFEELLARIRALLRREKEIKGNVLEYDDVVLDTVKHTVKRGDKLVDLTKKEFSLLEYFMRNPEVVLTRQMILEHVWDFATDPFTNTVDVHIRYLREKIDEPFGTKLINTVHGIGYRLIAPTSLS